MKRNDIIDWYPAPPDALYKAGDRVLARGLGIATVIGYTSSGFVGVSYKGEIFLVEESDLERR